MLSLKTVFSTLGGVCEPVAKSAETILCGICRVTVDELMEETQSTREAVIAAARRWAIAQVLASVGNPTHLSEPDAVSGEYSVHCGDGGTYSVSLIAQTACIDPDEDEVLSVIHELVPPVARSGSPS